MMMTSLVLRQKKALPTPVHDEVETTPESEITLKKKNYSSTDLSDGYKEMALAPDVKPTT